MKNFRWLSPTELGPAATALAEGGRALAGGVELLSLLKRGLEAPETVVNLKNIPGFDTIEEVPGEPLTDKEGASEGAAGGLRIGALVTLAQLQADERVRTAYPAVAEAARAVGSPQLRNMGTVGGNLCQRPRCWYFRDPEVECLKKGGDTCFAVDGENRYHAVLGGGPCFIVHPSDLAPALIAIDAEVELVSPDGTRTIPLAELFVAPGDDVTRETSLKPGEIVVAIRLPDRTGWTSAYVKARERESFDWPLASASVALRGSPGGPTTEARVVLGGLAPRPWRSEAAETALVGAGALASRAEAAGAAAMARAVALSGNAYKLTLGRNVVRAAALRAAGPGSVDNDTPGEEAR